MLVGAREWKETPRAEPANTRLASSKWRLTCTQRSWDAAARPVDWCEKQSPFGPHACPCAASEASGHLRRAAPSGDPARPYPPLIQNLCNWYGHISPAEPDRLPLSLPPKPQKEASPGEKCHHSCNDANCDSHTLSRPCSQSDAQNATRLCCSAVS